MLNSPLISISTKNQEIFEDLNNQERTYNVPKTPLDLVLEPHFATPSHSASTCIPSQSFVQPQRPPFTQHV